MPQVFETTDGVYDKERKLGGLKLITGQFWALLVKRFHHARRNRKGYISQVQKNGKSKQTDKQINGSASFFVFCFCKPVLARSLVDLGYKTSSITPLIFTILNVFGIFGSLRKSSGVCVYVRLSRKFLALRKGTLPSSVTVSSKILFG